MRVQVAVVMLATLAVLAGCASPPEDLPTIAEPKWITPDPVALAEGSFRWHETGTGAANPLSYYDLASQAIAHPCVWDGGGGGEEVYFNNLHLPTGRASQAPGAWSGNLSLSLDWTDQDWLGTALRVAYQAPGTAGWFETPPIERGSTLTVPIRLAPENNDTDDSAISSDWSVWVCLPEDSSTGPQQPFVGSVQVKVVFTPDPVLESMQVEDADSSGRTARGGSLTQPAL